MNIYSRGYLKVWFMPRSPATIYSDYSGFMERSESVLAESEHCGHFNHRPQTLQHVQGNLDIAWTWTFRQIRPDLNYYPFNKDLIRRHASRIAISLNYYYFEYVYMCTEIHKGVWTYWYVGREKVNLWENWFLKGRIINPICNFRLIYNIYIAFKNKYNL